MTQGLFYKEDWEEAKRRFEAWWHGEAIDRVAISVTAPRERPIHPLKDIPIPDNIEGRWLDPDYRIGMAERTFATTFYGGEAFPYFDSNIGPGSLALYLGSKPVFAPDTVWYMPIVSDIRELTSILGYDPNNTWWLANLKLMEEGVERGKGKYLTSIPDLIENLDTIASLRGTEGLLCDLKDDPEAVHEVQRIVLDLYFVYFEMAYGVVSRYEEGCCFSAFWIWAPGRMAKLQCDLSEMISERMFEEFVLPYLGEQCRRLEYSVYHLDGPRAIRHLDLLLSIPELNAIQWTPGAGEPGLGSPKWFPMYRKIREHNKSLLLLGVGIEEVEALVRELGPEGLLIGTWAQSEMEARELLEKAMKWRRTT